MEATYVSTDKWLKMWDTYTHNEILFSHKKEPSTDTLHNMDESWKHYAQGE